MAALRKLAAAATTSALLAPRARAEEAPAADEEQAAELRAKVLALAAAQRERTDWEARRLHQLMRAVDEEHARERAAMLEKAAAEDAKAFAEERARRADQRAKSDEAAAVRERAEARNGPRLFPARGAPLSPEDQARARANRLLTVIGRRPQPERERIWRRFRVFETYMG